MNNKRRDAINKLIGQIDDLKSQVETLKEEEEEALAAWKKQQHNR
jgi:molybdopterin synthase catalytic subunit